jgi:hypothetical protein
VTVAIRWAESKEFVTGGEFSAYRASSTGFPANILVSSGRCLYASRHGNCSFLESMALANGFATAVEKRGALPGNGMPSGDVT